MIITGLGNSSLARSCAALAAGQGGNGGVSQPKQRMAARSTLAFLALAGLVSVAQIRRFNLLSYLQYYEHPSGASTSTSPPGGRKRKRKQRRISDRDVDAILSRVDGNLLQREADEPASPACRPHFRAAVRSNDNKTWTWSSTAKFRRLYFYHTRKAGGTSLAEYFKRVAMHHGLEYEHMEWKEAEEPGKEAQGPWKRPRGPGREPRGPGREPRCGEMRPLGTLGTPMGPMGDGHGPPEAPVASPVASSSGFPGKPSPDIPLS